jgi:hypothetical protein
MATQYRFMEAGCRLAAGFKGFFLTRTLPLCGMDPSDPRILVMSHWMQRGHIFTEELLEE